MILKIISAIICISLVIFDLKYILKKKSEDEIKADESEKELLRFLDIKLKIISLIIVAFILVFAISAVCICFNQSGINKNLCTAWAIIQFIAAFVTLWCTFDKNKSINYKKERSITSIIYLFDVTILVKMIINLFF